MANDQSLTTAMNNLKITHGTSSSSLYMSGATSTSSRPIARQNRTPPSRITKSDILSQWEQDRFGDGESDRSDLDARRSAEQQQERSTVSSWQAFAESHRPKPLRDGYAGTQRGLVGENSGIGAEGESEHHKRLPKPSALRSSPKSITQGHYRGPVQASPQRLLHDRISTSPKSNPQDQIWRKRKNGTYEGQNEETPDSARQAKRASPNRPSPLSEEPSGNVRRNIDIVAQKNNRPCTTKGPLQHPGFQPQETSSTASSITVRPSMPTTSSPTKSRAKTTDETARRLIFAGIGAGRVPKRTEEELRKREEEQEKRRIQREERENLGREEVIKWCGLGVVKTEIKPNTRASIGKDLIRKSMRKPASNTNELTKFNGKEIQW